MSQTLTTSEGKVWKAVGVMPDGNIVLECAETGRRQSMYSLLRSPYVRFEGQLNVEELPELSSVHE